MQTLTNQDNITIQRIFGTNYGPTSDLAYEIVNNDIKEDNTSEYEMWDKVDNHNTTVINYT